MSRYEGPVFSEHDSRSSAHGNHHSIKRIHFPNYLENQEKRAAIQQETDYSVQPSPYISNDLMHTPADTVPFLRHNKEAFISYRDKEAVPTEDVFAVKKKHLQDEKLKERRSQSDMHPYAHYRSRRPFQLTEIPEPLKGWTSKTESKIDYGYIADLLVKPDEDLLLFDASVSEDDDAYEDETSREGNGLHPLHGKTKRAMNRSLLGIMAQERSFDVSDKFTQEAAGESQSAGQSYF
ncbi:Hypothetical protein Tpal_1465 [Trichococcus palustris]|jgi:hypothetical protein|uniref:Uncharacterized protein n=1 Tax=Trichococcus palustris TaxID=140314 RepID=A0A143YLE3_9LACT|nr:hypothetical protein [Trichococcus palustris]CZQ91793.1 Hypothetical protein Tpal_1465 [Trichococcus palustris]SFL04259.1 hypothetical protein SAMN04488076_11549 [Trichococcus palustris]